MGKETETESKLGAVRGLGGGGERRREEWEQILLVQNFRLGR